MDPSTYQNDPTLGEAMSALAEMEAAEQGQTPSPGDSTQQTPDSATTGERAPETGEAQAQTPETKPAADAPAAEAKAKTESQTEPKPGEQKPAAKDKQQQEQPKQSKFAQNQARLEGGWKTLNERKAQLEKAEQTFKEREAELARREKSLQAERQKASQPKYKPEDYEAAGTQWEREAATLEAQAKKLEAEGKFEEADKARELAAGKKVQAKQAKDYAGHIRANPPAPAKTDEQAEAEFRAQQKEWWGKAAVDFPNVAKAGTPEAEALKALIKSEPAVVNDPKGMYYAARLVTAETSSARVPALEKELGELRAKVKELGGKLAVPADGAVARPGGEMPFNQKSEAEQEAELFRMAEEIDARQGGR